MAVGDAWTGAYSWTSIKPGSWTVLPWRACLVLINNVAVSNLISCTNTNKIDVGSGECSMTLSDPDREQFELFEEGDEIQIYMSATKDEANKVWGGYLDTRSMNFGRGRNLTIKGADYSSRLLSTTFTDTVASSELSTAMAQVLGHQSLFTWDFETTVGKLVAGEFSEETLYLAIQKFCDVYGYNYNVGLDKVFRMKHSSIVDISPDTITEGVNISPAGTDESYKEYLCNKVTVLGSGGISQSATNAASLAKYGEYSKKITVASLTTSASVLKYAENFVAKYGVPIQCQKLRTPFLPYTLAGDDIAVSAPHLGMEGNYKVMSITRAFGIGVGFYSEVDLSDMRFNIPRQLGNFERRIRDIELEVF
jgi:hypothetical protein